MRDARKTSERNIGFVNKILKFSVYIFFDKMFIFRFNLKHLMQVPVTSFRL